MLVDDCGNMVVADMGAVQANIVVGERTRMQQPSTFTACHCPPEVFKGESCAPPESL